MVTISHQFHRLRRSEITCYVNGSMVSSGAYWRGLLLILYSSRCYHTGSFKMVAANAPFLKCHLGGSEDFSAHTLFKGQLAALYMFTKALSDDTIKAIHRLGPNYR